MPAKENRPLISLIAVSYNHEKWIRETLESIKTQTLQDFELIYCDDASSDQSAQIAMKWLEGQAFPVQTILHSENKGLCRTLNEALRHCRGKYVQVIACDDVLCEGKFREQVDLLEKSPENTALACSNFAMINEYGSVITKQYFSDDFQFPTDPASAIMAARELDRITIHSPTVLIRRDVFDVVGEFDESLMQEDYDMWIRVCKRFAVAYSNKPLVNYRVLQNSLSRSPERQARLLLDEVAVSIRHLDEQRETDDVARAFSNMLMLYSAHAAGEFSAVREELERLFEKTSPRFNAEMLVQFLRSEYLARDGAAIATERLRRTWTFRTGEFMLAPIVYLAGRLGLRGW